MCWRILSSRLLSKRFIYSSIKSTYTTKGHNNINERIASYMEGSQFRMSLLARDTCALLSSPELLADDNSSGSDKTNILEDFYDFNGWASDEKHLCFDSD